MSSEELIGKTLGQYEIRMVLGKGGMSTVYLAHQPSMDRVVAIKVLPREFLHDETFLQRFQQETRTIARLEHPHILPVYDAGEDQGVPYIVMRYLSGGSVADLIADRLPDNATIARIVTEIAGAMDYAHARGIIHRDLKPSNILLDSTGHAYLADFGIARAVAEASGLTGSRVIGTPTYIAPEQVQKGQPITHSIDIYALGVVVYEMLTGSPPFWDEDPTKTMMAHVLEPVPSVRSVDPNVSPEVDAVVRRALAKTPRERYASAGEFARALTTVMGVGPVEIGPLPASRGDSARTTPPPPIIPPPPGGYPAGASSRRVEPRQDYSPYPPAYEQSEPRRRQGGFTFPTWIIVPAVMLALLGGIVLTAYAITDGNPGRLFVVLTPASTRIQPMGTMPPLNSNGPENGPPAATARPAVLPRPRGGDRLAFASNRAGHYDIYVIDVDVSSGETANELRLTDQPGPDFQPAWSPDGAQIAYVSRPGLEEDAHIWVMDADGENKVQITDGDSDNTEPDWSPDGQWIAFASNRDGDFEIYVMRPDGSEVQQITNNSIQDRWPRWAPNGVLMAYHAREGSQSSGSELFIMDSSGGVPLQLTDNTIIDQWPDWAPDGLRLAFSSSLDLAGSQRAVFLLDFTAGNAVTQITGAAGSSQDEDPTWSPDGAHIAFDSNRDGDGVFDIFLINLATGQVIQLTDNTGDNVTPTWQPQQ